MHRAQSASDTLLWWIRYNAIISAQKRQMKFVTSRSSILRPPIARSRDRPNKPELLQRSPQKRAGCAQLGDVRALITRVPYRFRQHAGVHLNRWGRSLNIFEYESTLHTSS